MPTSDAAGSDRARCLHDPAVAQGDRPAAALGDLHVVRHDDDGRAEARVQVADQREDLLAGARVEIAGRFVGEQNRRIDRQRAGDRDALALAARELVGQMLQPVPSWTSVSSSVARSCTLRARPAAQMQRQPDVLEARQRRQQIEELKDEADLVAPDPRQPVVGQAGERFAVDADVAGGRPIEAADQIEQRRLAGARRADDRRPSRRAESTADVVERGDLALAGELLGDADRARSWVDYVNSFTTLSNLVYFQLSRRSATLEQRARRVGNRHQLPGRRIERHIDRRPSASRAPVVDVHDLVRQRQARSADAAELQPISSSIVNECRRAIVALGVNDDGGAPGNPAVLPRSRHHVSRHCSKYVKYTAWLTWPIRSQSRNRTTSR